ncbi:UNVERIFIED_CONTAM: hypothetical protein K2H54_060712 [Gekko kuhli]
MGLPSAVGLILGRCAVSPTVGYVTWTGCSEIEFQDLLLVLSLGDAWVLQPVTRRSLQQAAETWRREDDIDSDLVRKVVVGRLDPKDIWPRRGKGAELGRRLGPTACDSEELKTSRRDATDPDAVRERWGAFGTWRHLAPTRREGMVPGDAGICGL